MLLQKLLYGSTYAAVEHHTDDTGKESFSVLILQKNKDELIIKDRCKTNSFEKVIVILNKQKHVFIIFNTQQILEKKTDKTGNLANAMYTAFPNITVEEFYHELSFGIANDFIAVSRKDYVNTILEKYKKCKINIIGFSLGNLVMANLLPYLNKQEQLSTTNAIIHFSNNQISAIDKTSTLEVSYQINELTVKNTEVLCLSGILSYYAKNQHKTTSPKPNLELTKRFEQNHLFKIGLQCSLIVLLSILLINFFFFNTYFSEVNKLQTQMHLLEAHKHELKKIKTTLQKKEKLVNSIEKISNSKVSFYIDKIAKEIPYSILLQQINYQPLNSKIRKDKPVSNKENTILLTGKSTNSKQFTKFVEVLEGKKWIKKVIVIDLIQEQNRIDIFQLEIKISTDE